MNQHPKNLVTCEWLMEHLQDSNLVILDATMKASMAKEDEAQMPHQFIPRALTFDFESSICDPYSPLDNMMPTAKLFEQKVQQLGIDTNSFIVVYDANGIYSAPRAWWMFKTMGHNNVAVLDGGLPTWKKHSFPLVNQAHKVDRIGNFKAEYHNEKISSVYQVLQHIDDNATQIVDARSEARYSGSAPEPRPGMRSGHIPSSSNMPISTIIDDGLMLPKPQLESIYQQHLDENVQKLIFSCGSGVTACVLALGAEICGYHDISIYDGSWSEWGINTDLPIEQ